MRSTPKFAASLLFVLPILAAAVEDLGILAPGPAALEGIDFGRDGSIYVTSNIDNTIIKTDAGGQHGVKIPLPAHPQVVQVLKDGGMVVTAHAKLPSFGGGGRGGPPALTLTNLDTAILVLDKQGKVKQSFPGPADSFFNGITRLREGVYIVADSTGGSLWRLDLKAKRLERWFTDASVESARGKGNFGGSNGIKAAKGWVYYTSRGAMWKVKAGANGAAEGGAIQHSKQGGDDFDVAADGTIYIAGDRKMLQVAPDGSVSTLAEVGVDCPSVRLSPDGKAVIATTRGSFPGAPGPVVPSRLIKIELGK